MTAKVSRLPGMHCRFWLGARCAYEEMLNPGLHDAWRCQEELRIMRLYDRFIDQADGFGLTCETASDLWDRRLAQFPPAGTLCPEFVPGAAVPSEIAEDEEQTPSTVEGSVIDCARFHEGICLLLLPPCEGICDHYCRVGTGKGRP